MIRLIFPFVSRDDASDFCQLVMGGWYERRPGSVEIPRIAPGTDCVCRDATVEVRCPNIKQAVTIVQLAKDLGTVRP